MNYCELLSAHLRKNFEETVCKIWMISEDEGLRHAALSGVSLFLAGYDDELAEDATFIRKFAFNMLMENEIKKA